MSGMRTLGLVAAAVVLGLSTMVFPTRAQFGSEHIHQAFVDLPGPDGDVQRAHVLYPRRSDSLRAPPGRRYPVVIALHGRGESAYEPTRGANAWLVDYLVPRAFGALSSGRVGRDQLQDFAAAAPEHVARINADLAARPFEGVMLVTPYVPDLMAPDVSAERVDAYADWLAGPLLEAVRESFSQAARGRDGTGVDGVSMGGWLALEAGFRHPETFGAVGAIQPAIRGRERELGARARRAAADNAPQRIRLLSSRRDTFLPATRALSAVLREQRVPHSLVVVPGAHGYEFNRGPGSLELLRFGDRALQHEPRP